MISEISQRKTNVIWFHLRVESIKKKPHIYREQSGGCQSWGMGECEISGGGQKVQTLL